MVGLGYSNAIVVRLKKGTAVLTLALEAANENMNGEINQAMLDKLRLTRVIETAKVPLSMFNVILRRHNKNFIFIANLQQPA
jgi:hypothetical protein